MRVRGQASFGPRPGAHRTTGRMDEQSSMQHIKCALRREMKGRALSAWLRRMEVILEGRAERGPRPIEVFYTWMR